jgi:hypothetical protein
MSTAIVIPFRDRGGDPLRQANLDFVQEYWAGYDCPVLVVDDGRSAGQFNRSAAYNRGAVKLCDSDVLVYAESDMIVDYEQIDRAVNLARHAPGLVVPFTQYRYMGAADSERIRAYEVEPMFTTPSITLSTSRGAVNVLSRETLSAVGQWDESFDGNWYDDDAMVIAFEITSGPARFVEGAAYHLYHLPGWEGEHLTESDRAATERNRERLKMYEAASTPEQIRELTFGEKCTLL